MLGRNRLLGRWYPLPPIWLESRVGLEYAALLRSPVFAGAGVPRGEGRPVLLIPGFLAGDASLDIMRAWLRRNGYRALRTGIVVNAQSSEALAQRLHARLLREFEKRGQKVTLVGQSRGGVLAMVVAHRHPELVEQVITLGSPIGEPFDVHPSTMAAVHVARFVHAMRRGPRDVDAVFDRELRERAAVPVTSLYSRTDGIVSSRACLRDDVTCIEVGGSHVGMGLNRRVYEELAKLLTRPPVPGDGSGGRRGG